MSSGGPNSPIVGIDLGTTNSLVAIFEPAGPRVLADAGSSGMTPSVVRFDPDGSRVVGRPALAPAPPGSTLVRSVKRLMGRSKVDAAGDLPFLGFEVEEGPNRTARVVLPGAARSVTPQEVSALILGELRRTAEAVLGAPVHRAVVTVPAYFDDAQRQATRDAGRLAGLDVVRIVNEPTAAALAYGLGASGPGEKLRTIAVYDLGGGTFDISILRITPAEREGETAFFQVLATAGDTRLGGDDVDHLLAEHLAAGAGTDSVQRADLVGEAERVKIALSEHDRAVAKVPGPDGALRTRVVTRAELERLIQPLIDRTLAACERARTDANLAGPLDAVVLVGGSTRIPAVRRAVGAFFGLAPYTAIDPDRAVALGAAVQAGILSGAARGALLLDVIPLSLGIETAGGAAAKLIMRNSTVPTRAREMFSTQVDGQTAVKIHVVQGEREMVEHCRSLGVFHLRGIPPMPAGIPQLEVELLVDASGVLHVSAHERRSGRRAQLQVIPNHGLTREEVDRIERESFRHAREDMTRHRVVDLVVNSKLDLKWVGDLLAKFGDRLPAPDRERVAQLTADLRGFVERAAADWGSVDADAFYKAKETLDRESVRLQEISIAESLRGAGSRTAPASGD